MITLTLIAAVDRSWGIGKRGGLLTHIKEDLKWFKEQTQGCPVIMGRKTFDSLPFVLPNRTNIVLTKDTDLPFPEGVVVCHSVTEVMRFINGDELDDVSEVFVMGGGVVYDLFLPMADKLLLTHLDADLSADTFFPVPALDQWVATKVKETQTPNPTIPFSFWEYTRLK